MVNAYIINLDRAPVRLQNTEEQLAKTDIPSIRWRATDAKNPTALEILELKEAYKYCPPVAKAISLSHIRLARYLLANDHNSFALVLEDDININSKVSSSMLNAIAVSYNNWDIIRLVSLGFPPSSGNQIKNWRNLISGSAAAYLINKKGQEKLANAQIKFHIDIHSNFMCNVFIHKSDPPLFTVNTEDSSQIEQYTSATSLSNITIGGATIQYICGLPIFGESITISHCIGIMLLLLIIIITIIIKIK